MLQWCFGRPVTSASTPDARQPFADRHQHPRQVLVSLGVAARHHLLDLGVLLRVERGERKVLELPLEVLDAEPVSQRRVDVEGLLSGARCFHSGMTAMVLMLWSRSASLIDENPPVARHRDEHLSDRGRLLGLFGVELQPVQLGDAVDDRRHLGAEALLDLLEREPGVLDRVVEDRGGHRPRVETQSGDDAGDGQRVGDVGLARAADLARGGPLRPAGRRARPGRAGVVETGVAGRPAARERLQQTLEPGRPRGGAAERSRVTIPSKVPGAGPDQRQW